MHERTVPSRVGLRNKNCSPRSPSTGSHSRHEAHTIETKWQIIQGKRPTKLTHRLMSSAASIPSRMHPRSPRNISRSPRPTTILFRGGSRAPLLPTELTPESVRPISISEPGFPLTEVLTSVTGLYPRLTVRRPPRGRGPVGVSC